jgi:glyoxylase-like metal-dependent hydrolase (beta-lactamase superfamily II)
MENPICVTCGTQYPASETPPARCPICEDDRQYIGPDGQQWTTLTEMRRGGRYGNSIQEVAPGVTGIVTQPEFAIGEQAHLIQTPRGNILWDCISYLDDATIAEVNRRGGLAAIAISHPHFFTSMIAWSEAFGNTPIYLHADHESWVMRPAPAIRLWSGDTHQVLPGVALIRCGGHFPGSTVLHWADGRDGRGALFTSDTITVVADRRWVSFMYSYPNTIPTDERAVRRIAAAVEPYPFDVLYGGWRGRVVATDAKAAVARSADRYIRHLRGEAGPNNTPPFRP